ncbi:hypothetical protein [Parageobacillus galactosidasius]|uniref:Uncharacterized protein n=1 Tax=Parageobacillus galactosidasius TaxID=883812 RepID=A0A226QTB1_9BACL|nr:hypothetical protein [Parageobacillus galactosidasius]OXB94732.1 hypothetical protein B9L23_07665 [Parageobacillus galactosidasius]
MDIISYGIASKAAKQEQYIRNDVLGIGVEGTHPHVKARIDNLEKAIQGVVAQADKLIINDAINIMKAHAKLNAVAKSMKYKMHNMIFDDLLDLSGIDTTKSSGYVHDATNGMLKSAGGNYVIETKEEIADTVPSKIVLTVEEQKDSIVSIIPAMTSNTSPTGYSVSIKSSTGQYATPAYYAFDKNENNDFMPGNYITSVTLQIDLPAPEKVDKLTVKIGSAAYSVTCAPTNIVLKGYDSVTGSWTQLGVYSASGWTAGMKKEFAVNSAKSYASYQFIVNGTNGGSTLHFNEVDLLKVNNQTGIHEGNYYISRNNGLVWEPITPEILFYFNDNISPKDNKIRLKAELPADVQLLNYALTWA